MNEAQYREHLWRSKVNNVLLLNGSSMFGYNVWNIDTAGRRSKSIPYEPFKDPIEVARKILTGEDEIDF